MTTTLRVGSATDVGRVRAGNEDSKLVVDAVRVYGVADGMGGHRGGEVASAMAVESIEASLTAGAATETTQAALVASVEAANRVIFDRGNAEDELRGMGTTLCALAVVEAEDGGDEIAWVNVGDSRIYLFRDDALTQLSTDHNLVEDLRRDGQLTAEEAAVHPQRNIITRALGIDTDVDVDSKTLTAFTGDRFLLCSDGVFNEVSADQIGATMRRLADPREVADDLVRQANDHGGRDNITCVVVDVVDDGGRSAAAAEAADADAARAAERAAAQAAAAAEGTTMPVDDDPTTETLPPVGQSDPAPATDMAGFSTPTPAAGAAPPVIPAAGETDPLPFGRPTDDLFGDLDHAKGRHVTWRVVAFVVAILVVLAVAFGAIGWYAKRTYYVDFAANEVVVYQGQPGGLLMFHPAVKIRTGAQRSQLTEAEQQAVAKQQTFASLADARSFANHLKLEAQANVAASTTTTSTTTTTAPHATTTTKPATPTTTGSPTTTG